VEHALSFGYDRIHFADDVFTLNRKRVFDICGEIKKRRLQFKWECLARVDSIDSTIAKKMKEAGCYKIYFGIESGNNTTLQMMNKNITTEEAFQAVKTAQSAGLKVGAFFILYYPGETDRMVLNTLGFASSLNLYYVAFTLPYPIPGTGLYERLKKTSIRNWQQTGGLLTDHTLIFRSNTSELKMKCALLKGKLDYFITKRFPKQAPVIQSVVNPSARILLRLLR
jgi:anaerobic magnesium-protoporphyrin IX monomethyl ester cyclase